MGKPTNSQTALEAKFLRPHVGIVVLRERLFCELDIKRKHHSVWIAGPAGSGKTTLVASYLRERGISAVWCHIDEHDSDIASFFISLKASLLTAVPGCKETLPEFGPENLMGLPAFAQSYFRKLFQLMPPQSVLVLDDYHKVRPSSWLHEALRVAIDETPPHVSIVVASREDPPAEHSGLVAGGNIHVVERNALRFTIAETGEMSSLLEKGDQKETWLREASELTGGWAAGLIIMLNAAQQGAGNGKLESAGVGNEEVFNYFASELFEGMPSPLKAFLVRTAHLPMMTPQMANQIAGVGDATETLSDLHRRNFFTERIDTSRLYYSFHSLFRSFLLREAQQQLSPEELEVIRIKAAELLEEEGLLHDAFDLLQQAQEWDHIVRLTLTTAPVLVAQGQYDTLRTWIDTVPQEVTLQSPHLMFWKGVCHLPFNQAAARSHLEQAHSMFEQQNDAAGMLMAWPAIIETFMFEWADCHPMDKWISWVDQALPQGTQFPNRETEARVVLGVFNALMVRQPQHPMLPVWVNRLEALIPQISDPSQQVLISARLAQYCTITGEFSRGERLLSYVEPSVAQLKASPLAMINWYAIKVIYGWLKADWDEFHQGISDAARVSAETGVYVMDFFVNIQAAFGCLTHGDIARAETHVTKAHATLIPTRLLDGMMLHLVTAWLKLQQNEYARAIEHADAALAQAQSGGLPFGEALAHLVKSQVVFSSGDTPGAIQILREAWRVAKLVKSDHLMCATLFWNSFYSYTEGREADGDEALVSALQLARKERFANFPGWQQKMMALLCQKALLLEVEINQVQDLIRTRGLTPANVTEATEHWPWPIRIHVLGPFKLMVNDVEVTFSHKPKKKPIELLKLILALGGEGIPETRIADELWPDSDGDQAHQALGVTLHRLRQLFGEHKPIRVVDGALHLDRNTVWVDLWDFDFWLDAALEEGSSGTQERRVQALTRAIELYRGPFLPLEISHPWSFDGRERSRRKFVRAVSELGDALIETGRIGDAVAAYENAYSLEPDAEEIHARLRACQTTLGRTEEAPIARTRRGQSNSHS